MLGRAVTYGPRFARFCMRLARHIGESGGRCVASLERNILKDMASPSFLLLKINQLGDAIWFLPTVAGIRREFPDSRIDIVCNRSTAVIFEKSVAGVRAITVSYKHVRGLRGMLSLPRMALTLGLGRYDYALLSHDEPKFSHLLAMVVLARRRIGLYRESEACVRSWSFKIIKDTPIATIPGPSRTTAFAKAIAAIRASHITNCPVMAASQSGCAGARLTI
jgi:hypothetical protein